ncbi:5'/3'-nucleotidase SurE [Palleronia sp. LCG004]|uniref:5'/3'-nucleotidase SurE n=1 Tax=Palleronia sp. LCG004 TaxID=3079304 RepID=UPI002943263A|nr:5'/3'-nucleotidase SurE [Palleronia sp. LCG004]WOI57327.1 5'/3'-nucleotidase SurE [Palleronia sp. LCG004]
MRILITNDDGIDAPGLVALGEIARAMGDEVWTVAPAFEQSGVGHCVNYVHPTLVRQVGEHSWAVEGSPADCVLAALHDILPWRPDLILSGVNRGNNSAENVLYSGTIGAAMEGALQGVRSIALSQFYGPGNRHLDDGFDAARVWGERTIRAILDADLWGTGDYGTFYNVNFPPCPGTDVRGLRAAAQGFRSGDGFSVEPHLSPSGRRFLWVKGADQSRATEPGSDAAVNLDGYVSITPLTADLTRHDTLGALADALS